MSIYTDLTAELVSKLEGIAKIAAVDNNPDADFTDYPAATIIPAEGESNWETNRENLRIYAYEVNIYYETKPSGISYALEALYDLVDDVLDAFDDDIELAGFNPGPNNTLMTVEPTSAGWGEVPNKDLIFARIKIRVAISVRRED